MDYAFLHNSLVRHSRTLVEALEGAHRLRLTGSNLQLGVED